LPPQPWQQKVPGRALKLGTRAPTPADRLASLPIDGYRYDLSRRCTKHPTPGALAMVSWLEHHSSASTPTAARSTGTSTAAAPPASARVDRLTGSAA
jgi:hypothetical protein